MSWSASRKALAAVAIAELLAKALWFSGTAVIPQLSREWHAGLGLTSWLTLTVQLGFVAGALLLAATNLLDLTSAARIFAVSSLLGAAFTALFGAVAARHIGLALLLRFLSGMTSAGVYPTGMKVLTGWFQRGRGLAMGIVVGAITIGSALPHAVHIGSLPWQTVVYVCAGFSLLAALVMLFAVEEGPYKSTAPRFDIRQVTELSRNRDLRRANLGYLGHMWELYSMWGWITLLLAASAPTVSHNLLETVSFLAIAVGAIGCVWAGYVSDRNQQHAPVETPNLGAPPNAIFGGWADVRARSRVTIVAMAVSGSCCVLAAVFFHHFWLLTAIALVWGVAVVADSAQFSTITTEVADQRYVGTALTMQTALGFLLTSISIRAVAGIASAYGWRWAALSMAAGPALGILAMMGVGRQPRAAANLADESVAEITSP
jgi:MFS family permease